MDKVDYEVTSDDQGYSMRRGNVLLYTFSVGPVS